MKDNFSVQSKAYAQFRPKFPDALYDFILSHVKGSDLAWDAATGNGQTAVKLATHFKQVIATDISENQLNHATKFANIIYKKEPAETSSLQDQSVDLITVSQAIHWFHFEKFYEEVKRVAKPQAIIAAFSYSMLNVADAPVNKIVQEFYDSTYEYWDAERRYIDEKYQTIPFPFEEINAPVFSIEYEWTMEQLLGYIGTWSAAQHYYKKTGKDLVDEHFLSLLKGVWQQEKYKVKFPCHMRIGKVFSA